MTKDFVLWHAQSCAKQQPLAMPKYGRKWCSLQMVNMVNTRLTLIRNNSSAYRAIVEGYELSLNTQTGIVTCDML